MESNLNGSGTASEGDDEREGKAKTIAKQRLLMIKEQAQATAQWRRGKRGRAPLPGFANTSDLRCRGFDGLLIFTFGLSKQWIDSEVKRMYRSKKIDDQGQVINDKAAHVLGSGHHNVNIPSHLHFLQRLNQNLTSNYSNSSNWSTNHGSCMPSSYIAANSSFRVRQGVYASVNNAGRFLGGHDDHQGYYNWPSNMRLSMDKYGFMREQSMITRSTSLKSDGQHQTPSNSRGPNLTAQLKATEEHCSMKSVSEGLILLKEHRDHQDTTNVEKRKLTEFDLDLSLSLNMLAPKKRQETHVNGCKGTTSREVEELAGDDHDLSLSLFPPSKKQRLLDDPNQGIRVCDYYKEAHTKINPTRASTLDLTI
ncbi:hypothetical protein Scep_015569 [Stephania cephalantha]|uniref:Uncharacterized protein n=1 Tax=Stephania cephalantha TaxID=152367 RepID=A0AAP0J5D1_9MAGN